MATLPSSLSPLLALSLALLLQPTAAQTCTEGCGLLVGGCNCYTPYFTCNKQGGQCPVPNGCFGSCDMATWLIAVIVAACVLVVAAIVACCCGAQIRECCCSRRYTSTVGRTPLGPNEGYYMVVPTAPGGTPGSKAGELGSRLLAPAH